MNKRSWKQIKLAALTLTVFWLCAGAALAAGGGSQSDPLVTLSYLTQTVQPDILRQVDERANTRQADLMTQFEHRLDQLLSLIHI